MFILYNLGEIALYGKFVGTLQNLVGWDGVIFIDGVDCSLYGGNINRVCCIFGWIYFVFDNMVLFFDYFGFG